MSTESLPALPLGLTEANRCASAERDHRLHGPAGSQKLATELSERITILRFPLMVAVVFIHAWDPRIGKTIGLHYTGWAEFVCDYISLSLATVAVPLFFFLSGYLFFTGFAPSKANFYSNIGKRAKSLLIPFLFWNILCLTVTGIAQALPATSGFFSGRSAPIVSFKLLDYANAVLGLTRDPIAFQFWFIRDLMLLSLLSPLIYLLLKKASTPFLAALLVWWFAGSTYSLPILAREAVLFFSVGSLLAIRHIDLRVLDRIGLYSWIYVPLSIADTLSRHLPANHFVHRIAELCGILFVICATRYIWRARRLREILIALSSASFFVFASHEPLLTVVRKLSYRFLPLTGNIVVVSLYVGDTLLVVAICTAAYYFCARTMPAVTQIITGGRIGGASRSAPA